MSDFTFSLTDSDGVSREYDVRRHPGREGLAIVRRLAAIVLPPLAAALGPLASAKFAAKGAKGLLDDPEILKSIDMAALGGAAKTALDGVTDDLAWSILKYTNRGGKQLIGPNGQPTLAFDVAYSGNYFEVGKALWEVVTINRFFPQLDGFESVLKAGKAALAKASPASPGQAETTT